FKGGKGVATFLGTLIALNWPLGLIACATWALTAAVTRISSLSALLAAALAPVFAWGPGRHDIAAVAAIMAALIFLRHKTNITRLMAGTEPRIGRK
ncbi:MAG: glycerol-3-phosphate acyltransferase, partial [Paracoccus sp. (in: a-proteobacteria)]